MSELKSRVNELGQPVGFPMPDWKGCAAPPKTLMEGKFCRLEPLDTGKHAPELFEAFAADSTNRMWTDLPWGPFETLEALETKLSKDCLGNDPQFFAFVDRATGLAVGIGSFMRIVPEFGVIEVGGLSYSPALQRTPASTEAMYLMMRRAFDELGYRRYEWKCDSLNEPSRRAAERLGFTFEGVFRQLIVYRGRNRDTAWYSIIDSDWPALKTAFESWLAPSNFDASGQQIRSLASFRS